MTQATIIMICRQLRGKQGMLIVRSLPLRHKRVGANAVTTPPPTPVVYLLPVFLVMAFFVEENAVLNNCLLILI